MANKSPERTIKGAIVKYKFPKYLTDMFLSMSDMRCDISRLVPTCMLREGLTRGERKSSCWDEM